MKFLSAFAAALTTSALVAAKSIEQQETNAQRLARGLTPARPRKLYEPDRVRVHMPRVSGGADCQSAGGFIIGVGNDDGTSDDSFGFLALSGDNFVAVPNESDANCFAFEQPPSGLGTTNRAVHTLLLADNKYIGINNEIPDGGEWTSDNTVSGTAAAALDTAVSSQGHTETFIFNTGGFGQWTNLDGTTEVIYAYLGLANTLVFGLKSGLPQYQEVAIFDQD